LRDRRCYRFEGKVRQGCGVGHCAACSVHRECVPVQEARLTRQSLRGATTAPPEAPRRDNVAVKAAKAVGRVGGFALRLGRSVGSLVKRAAAGPSALL
jgi:hypothetical protein